MVEGLLTSPYVTVAEFKAAPTWIDVDDLIPGGVQAQQDAELNNQLLKASAWADGYTSMRLGAHTATENARTRINRDGRIFLHPSDVPVRQVTALAFGADPSSMTVLSDLSGVWVEDGRGIVVGVVPNRGSWSGRLEFGSNRGPGGEVFVQYQYVAGYACTTLSGSVAAGDQSLSVVDGTGFIGPSTALIGALDGSTVRIWDPAKEEAFKVGQGYTFGSATIPLAAPLVNAHAAGAAVSEMPAEVRQAVITYACALILRDEEGQSSGQFSASLRKVASDGSPAGLIADAQNWLERYRRTR